MCATEDDLALGKLISTIFFVSGLVTLLQVSNCYKHLQNIVFSKPAAENPLEYRQPGGSDAQS